MSHQPPNDAKKGKGLGNQHFMEKKVWYLREPKEMDDEGKWLGIFQLDRKESADLEKMTKSKATKSGSQKQYLEVLGKEELEVNPLDLPEEEGQLGTFGKETSKGENNEKIGKGPASNVADTTLVLVFRVANGGNQWYTKNPKKAL